MKHGFIVGVMAVSSVVLGGVIEASSLFYKPGQSSITAGYEWVKTDEINSSTTGFTYGFNGVADLSVALTNQSLTDGGAELKNGGWGVGGQYYFVRQEYAVPMSVDIGVSYSKGDGSGSVVDLFKIFFTDFSWSVENTRIFVGVGHSLNLDSMSRIVSDLRISNSNSVGYLHASGVMAAAVANYTSLDARESYVIDFNPKVTGVLTLGGSSTNALPFSWGVGGSLGFKM